MTEVVDVVANEQQGTPSAQDLNVQLAAEEAARYQPDPEPEAEKEEAAEEEKVEETNPEIEQESDFEKRIRLAYIKEREARQRNRVLEQEIARLKTAQANPQTQEDADFQQRVRAEAEKLAPKIADQQKYNTLANTIFENGIKDYPDFKSRLEELNVSLSLDGLQLTRELVEAANEIGDAHKLVYHLTKNPDQAEQIARMPPHQMALALGKVAVQLAKPVQQQSKAPDPIKPIGGKAKAPVDEEKMPIGDWIKLDREREKNRKSRFG